MDHASVMAWIGLVMFAVLAACSAPTEDGASTTSAVASPGRWKLPATVAAIGAEVRLRYDGAPAWRGAAACSGKLRVGTHKLGTFLAAKFAVIASIGGYVCRRNTADGARMSVHGTGRAMDVFIPRIEGQADNTKGDDVANWLVEHAGEIGIQLVIWDRSVWRGNGTNDAPYGGPHAHDDHIHVELTEKAGNAMTPWFATVASDAGGPDDGEDEDGGSVDVDGSVTPELDGGEPDAATADAEAPEAPDAADAAEPDAAPAPDAPGASDWELEEGDDQPGDRESVTKTRPTSRRAASARGDDDDAMSSGGCSASPTQRSQAGGAALLVAAAVLARRRRR